METISNFECVEVINLDLTSHFTKLQQQVTYYLFLKVDKITGNENSIRFPEFLPWLHYLQGYLKMMSHKIRQFLQPFALWGSERLSIYERNLMKFNLLSVFNVVLLYLIRICTQHRSSHLQMCFLILLNSLENTCAEAYLQLQACSLQFYQKTNSYTNVFL